MLWAAMLGQAENRNKKNIYDVKLGVHLRHSSQKYHDGLRVRWDTARGNATEQNVVWSPLEMSLWAWRFHIFMDDLLLSCYSTSVGLNPANGSQRSCSFRPMSYANMLAVTHQAVPACDFWTLTARMSFCSRTHHSPKSVPSCLWLKKIKGLSII